jgi:hypothetical protein
MQVLPGMQKLAALPPSVGAGSVEVVAVEAALEVVPAAAGKPKPGTGAATATRAEATRRVMKRMGFMFLVLL